MPAKPSRVLVVLKPANGEHGLVLSAFSENALLDNNTCVRNEELDKIKCGEFSLEIVDFDTTSINKITETATVYHNANIFVCEDLVEYYLKYRNKKDNFCHRRVHEAAKLQQRVIWSNWWEWSKCTSVCGSSSRTRTRSYELEGEENCVWDQADAKYAYIVASYENGNTGPNSPRDVVRRRQT